MVKELQSGEGVPRRNFATIGDKEVTGYDPEERGAHPNPDSVTRYDSVAWSSYFQDAETKEIYKVRCTDGVNGGRGPYSPEDQAALDAEGDVPIPVREVGANLGTLLAKAGIEGAESRSNISWRRLG